MEEIQHKTVLRKRIIKILLVGVGSILLLISTAGVIAFVYEKEITGYFLQQINSRINTRVEIKEINLSLIRHFPYASIGLKDVKANHAKPFQGNGYLLQASEIEFKFNLLDLFSKHYEIKGIEMINGNLNFIKNKDGLVNYILLQTDTSGKEKKFSFSLRKFTVKNVDFTYRDQVRDFFSSLHLYNGMLKGNFNETWSDFTSDADLQIIKIQNHGVKLLENRPFNYSISMKVDKSENLFSFRKGDFRIAGLDFSATGFYSEKPEPNVSIELKGNNLDIRSFLSLLPPSVEKRTAQYESDGLFYCEAGIQGKLSGKGPDIKLGFGIRNGEIKNKDSDVKLTKIALQGEYLGKFFDENSELRLKNVKMLLNNQEIAGSLFLKGTKNPQIKLNAHIHADLSDLQRFFPFRNISNMSGLADLNLSLAGKLDELKQISTNQEKGYEAKGILKVQQAAFKIIGDTLSYKDIDGVFRFTNQDIMVDKLTGKAGSSDFKIEGTFHNFMAWLLGNNQRLGIKINAFANSIDLDELFQRKAEVAASHKYRFAISPKVDIDIDADIRQIKFRKFSARDISGNISVNNMSLKAKELRFSTMNGKILLNGKADASSGNMIKLDCRSELTDMDIQKVFYECENFGQETIMDKNIKGKMNAMLTMNAECSPELLINPSSVICNADITINNGELIQFAPLRNLSRYISVEELSHVRFSQLQNQIFIKNRKISFPLMDIKSSAINISAYGTHDFDNNIDYHIKVKLSEIISRKARDAKKENKEFGEIENEKQGGMNLYLAMKGPVDKPKISYDFKASREKRKNDIQQEKRLLKQLIIKEFKKNKDDGNKEKSNEMNGPSGKKTKIEIEFDE